MSWNGALEIWQLWHTAGSDFIKTNHQCHIKTLTKIHNIFIKIGTLCDVLSFNITYVFRQFAGEKCLFTCWYARRSLTTLACPASTLATLMNAKCLMPRRKWLGTRNWHTQKPTLESSWNFKFLDETKTATYSKHLHTNETEMYGKGKYVEINNNTAMTISWNVIVMSLFLSADTQILSRPEA